MRYNKTMALPDSYTMQLRHSVLTVTQNRQRDWLLTQAFQARTLPFQKDLYNALVTGGQATVTARCGFDNQWRYRVEGQRNTVSQADWQLLSADLWNKNYNVQPVSPTETRVRFATFTL